MLALTDIRDNPHILAAAQQLGVPPAHMVGYWVCLRLWAQNYPEAPYSPYALAGAAGWEGDAQAFCRALWDSGCFVAQGNGFALGDWDQKLVRRLEERTRKQKQRSKRSSLASQPCPTLVPGNGAENAALSHTCPKTDAHSGLFVPVVSQANGAFSATCPAPVPGSEAENTPLSQPCPGPNGHFEPFVPGLSQEKGSFSAACPTPVPGSEAENASLSQPCPGPNGHFEPFVPSLSQEKGSFSATCPAPVPGSEAIFGPLSQSCPENAPQSGSDELRVALTLSLSNAHNVSSLNTPISLTERELINTTRARAREEERELTVNSAAEISQREAFAYLNRTDAQKRVLRAYQDAFGPIYNRPRAVAWLDDMTASAGETLMLALIAELREEMLAGRLLPYNALNALHARLRARDSPRTTSAPRPNGYNRLTQTASVEQTTIIEL